MQTRCHAAKLRDESAEHAADDPFHDLMVSELYGEGRWRLDTHAMLIADPASEPDLGGDVLYTVFDGERTGLWRSALP